MDKVLINKLIETLAEEHLGLVGEYETFERPHVYKSCTVCKLLARARGELNV